MNCLTANENKQKTLNSIARLGFFTCDITYRYKSVAILVASDIFLQSINQNLADTVVVNETQSLTNVNGVDPVTSSHWALIQKKSD